MNNITENTPEKTSWIQRLQERWTLKSVWQVNVVLIVFCLTGTTVLFIKKPLFALVGMDNLSGWLKWGLYILIMYPLYSILLISYGALLGQFQFFWNFIPDLPGIHRKMQKQQIFPLLPHDPRPVRERPGTVIGGIQFLRRKSWTIFLQGRRFPLKAFPLPHAVRNF